MNARRVRVTGSYFKGQLPAGAVYVGRSAPKFKCSPWHNPFKAGEPSPTSLPLAFAGIVAVDAAHAVELFRQYALVTDGYVEQARAELAGRDLACWCPDGAPCHVDVLLELVNQDRTVA